MQGRLSLVVLSLTLGASACTAHRWSTRNNQQPDPPYLSPAEMSAKSPQTTGTKQPDDTSSTTPPAAQNSVADILGLAPSQSTSLGGPRDGRIEGAVSLPQDGPGFRSNPRRPNTSATFGTVEMVQALILAAQAVQSTTPGSTLFINDLGFETGGPIPHHGSHQAGRDVDVLFYLLDAERQPRTPIGAFLDPRGIGYDFADLSTPDDDVLVRLDRRRTWQFLAALIEGPHGDLLQRIFVAEHLRTLLLREARRSNASSETRERFATLTCQPSSPHDDHLHLRFFCSFEDQRAGCRDSAPTYRWRRRALRAAGLRPQINRPRPDRPRAPRVTAAEARANAGPMHARVERWLERREQWLSRPHPGRTYCR